MGLQSVLSVLALAGCLGGALVAPRPAAARTYDLRVHVFCPDDSSPCGLGSEESIREDVLRNVQEMNLQWRPNGISFRPAPPEAVVFHYGTIYNAITDGSGPSADPSFTNAELTNQIRQEFAVPEPGVVTLFLIPGLAKCWAGPPPKPFPGEFGIFCVPGAGQGPTYAHEMGHYFCLRHTMSFQDLATHVPPDHEYDDNLHPNPPFPPIDFGVEDTPADPGPMEESDRNEATTLPIPLHEWCVTDTKTDVDPGSPHASYCSLQCRLAGTGGSSVVSAFSPFPHNAMSYYGADCRGPFVRSGVRTEAFTAGQTERIATCIAETASRAALPDVCASRGGDLDADGLCDFDDVCEFVANTYDEDPDGDGTPSACDGCPNLAGPQTDGDGDGIDDPCDPDRDNDGCGNATDQNPDDAATRVGSYRGLLCQPPSGTILGFEGLDSDGDGDLNCEDADDDDDGIADEDDECPVDAGGAGCHQIRVCGAQNWWEACLGGGCVELFAKLVQVINPDPTRERVFDHVSIVNQTLFLGGIPGETISETARSLGAEQAAVAAAAGPTAPERRRLELWSKRTNRKVTDVFEYDPALLQLQDTTHGAWLVLEPPAASTAPLVVRATWAPAAPPGGSLADADGDGIPDARDNCIAARNPSQQDSDGDRYGNACDPDLDNDGRISFADLALLRNAFLTSAPTNPFDFADLNDTPEEGPPLLGGLAGALLGTTGFKAAADFNGDGTVNFRELAVMRRMFFGKPGPSGLAP